ncbi:MAG: NUMOD3 domain-containing DNA-binding protein [Candidatus Nealsonbacteria bacterium]
MSFQKGHPQKEETREKIRQTMIGNKNPMWGRKHSKETIAKMKKSRTGQPSNTLGKHWKVKDTSNYSKVARRRHYTEETKKKISESKKGENHSRWIKDRSLIAPERNSTEYRQWRYQIFKRDRHICRINNEDCSGEVVAHHILSWSDFPELRYNINNGITLCQAHHPRKRAEEKRLIPFFKELVPVSNEL